LAATLGWLSLLSCFYPFDGISRPEECDTNYRRYSTLRR